MNVISRLARFVLLLVITDWLSSTESLRVEDVKTTHHSNFFFIAMDDLRIHQFDGTF